MLVAVPPRSHLLAAMSCPRTVSIVWGSRELSGRTARTVEWYRELLGRAGAATEDVVLAGA